MTKANHAEPTVCAVMLTRDRPEYARRAVECFRAQTYANKRLLIVNSGMAPIMNEEELIDIDEPCFVGIDALNIGQLRNHACKYASHHYAESWTRPEIFAHWDDDDWSHPNRIAEQVSLLQASCADCVGYREMLFWRDAEVLGMCLCTQAEMPTCQRCGWLGKIIQPGEAYLYSNLNPTYCLGTSLCYWRRTWESNPFSERNGPNPRERGEDREFLRSIKSVGISANIPPGDCEPRMIARIHAGNARHYDMDELVKNSDSWRRVPEWDDHCRTIMEAK